MSDLLQWLNAHPELAGLATFIISAAESIAIIGTIVPGTVTMTAIGALAGAGVIPLWATLLWAILGAVVGDGISYWIGRYFNERLPSIWPFRTHPTLLENGELFFRKHGGMSVFIGRFVGPVRALVPLVAGMLGMSPIRFTIANVLSAIGWAPAYMFPGIILGAASLELPPDIAAHALLMFLLFGLFIILCIWIIQKILKLISHQIDQLLTATWNRLRASRYFSLITKILQHHNPNKTHGQLTLAFYFIVTCIVLLYLTSYISVRGSQDIFINNLFFHLFRSLRTSLGDTIMIFITMLGEKRVLLPLIITVFGWLAWNKRWHTALHVLALGFITAGSIEILKLIAHSSRPWGISHSPDGFSFPSGHATMAFVFYLGIALLLMKSLKIKSRRIIYTFLGLLIFTIGISRVYLGAHWFTDILGGWLLGAAILMLISISYNRKPEKYLYPTGIILTILLTLFISYGINAYRSFNYLKQNSTQMDWPIYTISLNAWWNRLGNHLPLYRINRFGLSEQILNLQWVGDLNEIKATLLQQGWVVPPERDWINALHRISDIRSTEYLPLVSPLYLDKNPVLVLFNETKNGKLVVLRLWQSNLIIENAKQPLWVGAVDIIPRTYSWIFQRKKQLNKVTLKPSLLFDKPQTQYIIKEVRIQSNKKYHPNGQSILLIKPTSSP